jgi:hypothetical protein
MSDPQHGQPQQPGWVPPGQPWPTGGQGSPPPGPGSWGQQPGPWGQPAQMPPGQVPPGQVPVGHMPPGRYPPPRPRSGFPRSPALIVALCGVVAGAVFEISVYSTHEVNGVVTDCSYTNFGPIVFGPLGIVAGLWAVLARGRRPPERRSMELGLGLVCVALGLLHVLGGLDLLGGFHLSLDPSNPC